MLLWEILSVSEQYLNNIKHEWVCESRSVVSDSLWPHGLYSPWNSPGQNTGVGSLSLLQEFFPMQGSNPGLPHCRRILYQLSHREAQEYWSGYPIPSPVDLPTQESNQGLLHCRWILLPTELSGKPLLLSRRRQWQPTPVVLPGKSHGWRNLVVCSPWGR